jgi:hypothetical protein
MTKLLDTCGRAQYVFLLTLALLGPGTTCAQAIDRITVPEKVIMREIVYQPGPEFSTSEPDSQKFLRHGGEYQVHFRAVIAPDGTILQVNPISGDPWLIKVALRALPKWRFHACTFDGQPVEVGTTLTVFFNFGAPYQ